MRYCILSDPNVVATKAQGVLTISEILKDFQQMSQDPMFNPNSHYLHDFRDIVNLEGNLLDHKSMADFAVSIASNEPHNVVFFNP